MSILAQVKRGVIKQPVLTIIYGPDGLGKSTFGAEAPSPVFLGTERGTYNLDVARLPSPTSYKAVDETLKALANEKHDFKTLVIDSLDWLEPLVWEQVVFDQGTSKVKSIEDIGYARGYIYALEYWRQMQARLSQVRDAGLNVILIAHSHVKEAKDPTVSSDYNRYQLKLHDKAAALWREFVDAVLFLNVEVTAGEDKKGKVRAYGDGTRYLFTERRPAFDAKNRFGLPFQIEVKLGDNWGAFTRAMAEANPEDPGRIAESIAGLLQSVTDEKVRANAQASLNDALAARNVEKLKLIHTKLGEIVNSVA